MSFALGAFSFHTSIVCTQCYTLLDVVGLGWVCVVFFFIARSCRIRSMLILFFSNWVFVVFFSGDWQRHVQGQVLEMVRVLLGTEDHQIVIKFVRHSPGRRRNAETSMYDVATASKANAYLIKSTFSQFRRKENPVPRPPELADVNVFPLVRFRPIFLIF